jgi:hypothetical protein
VSGIRGQIWKSPKLRVLYLRVSPLPLSPFATTNRCWVSPPATTNQTSVRPRLHLSTATGLAAVSIGLEWWFGKIKNPNLLGCSFFSGREIDRSHHTQAASFVTYQIQTGFPKGKMDWPHPCPYSTVLAVRFTRRNAGGGWRPSPTTVTRWARRPQSPSE